MPLKQVLAPGRMSTSCECQIGSPGCHLTVTLRKAQGRQIAPCRTVRATGRSCRHAESCRAANRSKALQELNEKRVTLMEGSALSERDLNRAKAESSSAAFVLANRFSSNYKQEDLNVQFQVRASQQLVVCSPKVLNVC